jgi:hypothetical protein
VRQNGSKISQARSRIRSQTCEIKLDTHEYRNLPVYSGLNLNGCRTSRVRTVLVRQNGSKISQALRACSQRSRTRSQTCEMKLDTREYRNLPVYSGLNINGCRTSARQSCTHLSGPASKKLIRSPSKVPKLLPAFCGTPHTHTCHIYIGQCYNLKC